MMKPEESTIKIWWVLTVEHACKIVKQKEDDTLGKARKLVERANAQVRNMYKKLFVEAAKVACKYRLDGHLEPLYIGLAISRQQFTISRQLNLL
jgi:hypothetical protein